LKSQNSENFYFTVHSGKSNLDKYPKKKTTLIEFLNILYTMIITTGITTFEDIFFKFFFTRPKSFQTRILKLEPSKISTYLNNRKHLNPPKQK
jgi:hypothetical protein